MQNANINLGIEALLRYASTDTYRSRSSWTTAQDFKPASWWQRLDSNQPHTDFQSAALPDELRRQKLVLLLRIELRITPYHGVGMPFTYKSKNNRMLFYGLD